jgi:type 2 lantibiotic biosynthesis protein LanM
VGLNWYQGLTLAERLALGRISSGDDSSYDSEVAAFKFRKWRGQAPFNREDIFQKRLAADDLDEQTFLLLLGESSKAIRGRLAASPDWLNRILKAFPGGSKLPDLILPEHCRQDPANGFLQAVTPLLEESRHRIFQSVDRLCRLYPLAPLNPFTATEILLYPLPQQLLYILGRTMALELHVARMGNLLRGKTTVERFQSFTERLRSPRVVRRLFEEYPVLARLVLSTIDHCVESGEEMLSRLCEDWPLVRDRFSPNQDPGPLISVRFGAGDRHCEGRSVNILHFESGFKLVYKPRPVSIQLHFNRLVHWLTARGAPDLRGAEVVDCGSHGWVEFIATDSCDSAAAVDRFYWRQGALLALLYLLRGTDVHGENIIAAGEHPVIIDLETLFLPLFGERLEEGISGEYLLANSVMMIGLLPRWIKGGGNLAAFEFSGLGGKAGQVVAQNVPYWEAVGTDEMRLSRRPGMLRGFSNLPKLKGVDLSAFDYADHIVRGFVEMYRTVVIYRDDLLERDGPLSWFANDAIRIVMRATRFYAMLLDEGFHPDVLRHGLDRERHFDRLWFGANDWPETLGYRIDRLIASERDDLWASDIPYFHASVSGYDLLDSKGRAIEGAFARTGMSMVRERLLSLGEEDLDRQVDLVKSSLLVLSLNTEPTWPSRNIRRAGSTYSRERLLAAAVQVGEVLEKKVLRSRQEATWVGITRVEHGWQLLPLGLDLYSGLPGVVLFLAHLGRVTRDRRYDNLAQDAWNLTQRKIQEQRESLEAIGGFEGWGGLVYVLTMLASVWERQDLLCQAVDLLKIVDESIGKDERLDIIGGSAGCIASLLTLHQADPLDAILSTAIKCGDRLIEKAKPQKSGLGWNTSVAPDRALTGLSHGAAGIGWALAQLGNVTQEERFLKASAEAFSFERSVFDARRENWPDLRTLNGANKSSFMTAWCHGAPGIGLSRLDLLRHYKDEEIYKEVESAIRTTLSHGFGSNLSLCHGDLGNMELVSYASRFFNRELCTEVEQLGAGILDGIDNEGFRCGVPLGVESPGMMVGLAGIGLGLLRLADPLETPCVLLLSGPTPAAKQHVS